MFNTVIVDITVNMVKEEGESNKQFANRMHEIFNVLPDDLVDDLRLNGLTVAEYKEAPDNA